MAVIKAVSSKAGIGQALDYVTKEEKTEEKLVSGLHCEADTVKDEMQATKELWGKTGGRTYKHFVQSYHEDEHITPEQAHKNAIELAKNTEAWKGHEVLIATHIDRGHIHSHFIVNSVNYEDGHKLQWSNQDLKDLKERCNEQSREQGLHVPEKGKTFSGEEREETVAWNKDTYNILKQAEQGKVKSYVQDIALAVLDCKETATSRQDFIERMEQRGYKTDWQDNHKYITWTDLARENAGEKACKIRDNKLQKYYNMDFGKEELERGFEINARSKQTELARAEAEQRAREQLARTAIPENNGTGTPHIGAFLNQLNADERASEEKRDNSKAERKGRDIQQERLNQEAERRAREAEQRARESKAKSRSRSYDGGRAVKKEYAERERELARTQAEANKAKIDAEDTRSHQKELVNEKAQQMYNSRRKSLESAYQGK